MKCPFCAYEESKVIDSRPTDEGERIRRRRECMSCGKRFTTYEIIESVPIVVVKKDKSREVFDRDKLFNGMMRACEKRPVSVDVIEKAIDEIEAELQNSLDREVTSVKIPSFLIFAIKYPNCSYSFERASIFIIFPDVFCIKICILIKITYYIIWGVCFLHWKFEIIIFYKKYFSL